MYVYAMSSAKMQYEKPDCLQAGFSGCILIVRSTRARLSTAEVREEKQAGFSGCFLIVQEVKGMFWKKKDSL